MLMLKRQLIHQRMTQIFTFALLLGVALLFSRDGLISPVQAENNSAASQNLKQYLPITVGHSSPKLATRMGYGVTWKDNRSEVLDFPKAHLLRAGWYLNWSARSAPSRPNGMEYAQMVRVHQRLDCVDGNGTERKYHAFREDCPYMQPTNSTSSYRFSPSQAQMTEIAQKNPGATWLVGNEIERTDWGFCALENIDSSTNTCTEWYYNGQDEILPETYAIAYHELYNMIKAVDPTAQVAIGGIIQATPLRLQYLDRVWDEYLTRYGSPMPVDIWNVHAFVFPEKKFTYLGKTQAYGSGIPAGIAANEGIYSAADSSSQHIDLSLIEQQLRDMRQWMKDRGQQNKQLIISEYGVVYSNASMGFNSVDPAPIYNFMIDSSELFLNLKDCDLGYTADDCRLVQRWNWFSLDGRTLNANAHGPLLDPNTGQLSTTGLKWIEYVEQHIDELHME